MGVTAPPPLVEPVETTPRPAVVVGVDGGGSKTDAVAIDLAGHVVGRQRGPGSNPQACGLPESVAIVEGLVRAVAGEAPVRHAGLYLSGLDLPREVEAYRAAVAGRAWAQRGLDVANDLFALLRAGTAEPDAIAVVCGTGINALGLRADGATVRFPALGAISGDWGGGSGLGLESLWHAARDVDGRGPRTALTPAICAELGVASIPDLIEQLHFGERDWDQLTTLAPLVFAVAEEGDDVARGLVDRLADEVAAFVRACVHRLELSGDIPVVLGGGILQGRHDRLLDRIAEDVIAVLPRARLVIADHPPIVGAALLALEHAGAAPDAVFRAIAELTG